MILLFVINHAVVVYYIYRGGQITAREPHAALWSLITALLTHVVFVYSDLV